MSGNVRELLANQLAEVAGGYTVTAAGNAAAFDSGYYGGDFNGQINPSTPGWAWIGDGHDNGAGGFAVYYNSSLNAWGYGADNTDNNGS